MRRERCKVIQLDGSDRVASIMMQYVVSLVLDVATENRGRDVFDSLIQHYSIYPRMDASIVSAM